MIADKLDETREELEARIISKSMEITEEDMEYSGEVDFFSALLFFGFVIILAIIAQLFQ